MCKTNWIHAALCAGLTLSLGVTPALGSPPESPKQRGESDRAFLKQALGVNELELRLGRLATERATTPEVKAMGQKMVQKHTELGQQLSDLAKQSGISGDAEMSPDEHETLARVESQSGPEFDRVFRQTVDDGHVKELAMYRDEVSRAGNEQLRVLAEQRVAALQKSMAGAAQSKVEKQ
jgi:putative membrane protein